MYCFICKVSLLFTALYIKLSLVFTASYVVHNARAGCRVGGAVADCAKDMAGIRSATWPRVVYGCIEVCKCRVCTLHHAGGQMTEWQHVRSRVNCVPEYIVF